MTRVCVIGAGPSGIAAAKNVLDAGFTELVVYDRGREVGGNWVFSDSAEHSSVFETTHIISSRAFSQYDDFPMPDDYPDYPSHSQLAAYFQSYARHFGLYPHIRFQALVKHCERRAGGKWAVTVEHEGREETGEFDWLFVCNGHHWKPRWPEYPGTFTGEWLHSHTFKRAAPFAGKRVLVIGGGNSACDVAVETARVAARTDLSWRRGYWIVPKFIFGKPADELHNDLSKRLRFVPERAKQWMVEKLLALLNGPNSRYGLAEPDHHFGGTHPTVNSELLYFIRHGAIGARPDLARLDGRTVHFTDGRSADYDAVIACTGYEICHPFFDSRLIDYSHGPVPLYLRMIHPRYDNLFFIGLFQPFGCIWPAAELQSKIAARRMTGAWRAPADLDAAIADELAHPDVAQLATPRHTITVDYPRFRRRLQAELGVRE